ncbi:protein Z-dependent protease inhibitor-like, partial [Clarias magur]
MESIFHEKQEGSLCAQHCLNNLLQGEYFTPVDLSSIAQQLDEEERMRMAEGGLLSEEYRTFLQQPSGNMDDSGFFSIQVISNALSVWGLELILFNSREYQRLMMDPINEKAFICNYKEHWFTVRKLGHQWFNLNSLLTGPELISDTYLALFLAQLQQEGYSIFVIRGNLPECEADQLLQIMRVEQQHRPKLIGEDEARTSGQRTTVQHGVETQHGVEQGVVDDDDEELRKALALSRQDIEVEDEEADLRRAIQLSMQDQTTTIMELAFSLLICASLFTPSLQYPEARSPNITDLTFKNIDFAMNLYVKIASSHDNNIFFSPLSVSTAFAALSLGARNATRHEILSGLNLDTLEKGGQLELIPQLFQHLQGNISQAGTLKLEQGTALFVDLQFQIENSFSDQIKLYFNADVQNVEFKNTAISKEIINKHVEEKTGGKVKEMVTALDPLTRMMLINTIFFQGAWKYPFNPNGTEIGRFYVDKYNVVQVPMMFCVDKFSVASDDELRAKVLRLPYLGGASMLIVLPDLHVDYTTIDDEINAERFLMWIKNMKQKKLEVSLPKFTMEQSYALHNILPAMGIQDVFKDTANFKGMSQEPGLKISQVLHKAVIEVNEKGTTAAAATSVGITPYSMPESFVINRPFFFFIYHEATNSLLFMGR